MESPPSTGADNHAPSDPDDFIREALARYEGPLMRYAFSLTGDLESAQDVVQDTFMRLCAQEPRDISPFLSRWLFTVCRNRALDVLRKSKRMSDSSEADLELLVDGEPSPAEAVSRRDSAAAVGRLLAELPRNQREVVRLKFQQQMSYQEIAQVTDLSVTNVGFLLHTALRTLRHQLEGLERSPLKAALARGGIKSGGTR